MQLHAIRSGRSDRITGESVGLIPSGDVFGPGGCMGALPNGGYTRDRMLGVELMSIDWNALLQVQGTAIPYQGPRGPAGGSEGSFPRHRPAPPFGTTPASALSAWTLA